jgi:hypothetical protein
MVIAIGANGDGVLHWRHYVHHHWSQWIALGTIFMSPLAPMARTPNRYDTLASMSKLFSRKEFPIPLVEIPAPPLQISRLAKMI